MGKELDFAKDKTSVSDQSIFAAEIKKTSFEEHLLNNGIKVIGAFTPLLEDNISEKTALEQLEIIAAFHGAAMTYNKINTGMIRNKLGKSVEKYKINIKNLKREVSSISANNVTNEFENILVESSEEYMKRAEQSLQEIYASNYIGLIKRSMKRYEISLGNTYFTNLRKNEGIEIASLKRCAYNMLEIDGVYFINKMKRNGYKLDFEKLISSFCDIEGFNSNSNNFIKALISYPHEYMKCIERYRENRNMCTVSDFKLCLKRAMEKDGESIL